MWADPWLPLIAVAVGAAFTLTTVCILCRRCMQVAEWMPGELKGNSLAYVERTFRSDARHPIVARVDRAYRRRDGLITLVELKTREDNRVHASDIVELSAQRLALMGETHERVAPFAFVVVESERGRKAHRVALMPAGEVQALVLRREQLLKGGSLPQPASHLGLCAACAYRSRCHPGPTHLSEGRASSRPLRLRPRRPRR